MTMPETTQVTHRSTSNVYIASTWLNELPDIIALDFEAALRFTPDELASAQTELDSIEDKRSDRALELAAILKASALSHPAYVVPTHLSIGISESEAIVIIIDSDKMLHFIMNWLVTTKRTQIWHNASYDFKLIFYYTQGKLPINFEDSAVLAKCLLNHVEIFKARVRLKDLMGYKYGDWAISADNFDLSQIHEPHVIKYAAIDACATFALWNEMTEFAKE